MRRRVEVNEEVVINLVPSLSGSHIDDVIHRVAQGLEGYKEGDGSIEQCCETKDGFIVVSCVSVSRGE
jgi:hypothetical protein